MGNYEYMQNELLGPDDATKLVASLDQDFNGEFKKGVPKEARHAMVFHMMEWRYDPYDHFWVSEGDISLATMGEQNVWRTIQGKVAIDREDGRVLVYLHFGKKHWYFFEYKALQGWMNLTVQEQLEPEQTGLATCLLYTSPSPRDLSTSRMPSSA